MKTNVLSAVNVSVRRTVAMMAALLMALSGCHGIDPEPDPEPDPELIEFALKFEDPSFPVVWPSGKGEPVVFPFTVTGADRLPSLDVELKPGAGLEATCTVASDHMSGEVRVSGTPSFTDPSASVDVTARSGDATASASVTVVRALMQSDAGPLSFTSEGGSATFSVLTNLECVLSQDEGSRQFASVSRDGSTYTVSVSGNMDFESRKGAVRVSDPAGILDDIVVPFTQAGSGGSRYTDSLALVKFYSEMEMSKWKEQGSFDVLYANWCTDAPLENWCGVITDSDVDPVTYESLHDGRVKRLNLLLVMADGSVNTRPIPECIGDLKALVQIDLAGDFVGELPLSLGSLPSLNRIHVFADVGQSRITGDLNGHPLKNIASHIKFWDVSGDLYGTVPVWFSEFADFRIDDTHYSGRIPDEVVQSYGMQKQNIWYETIAGIDLWTLKEVDATILKNCSLSSYALWYGEQTPEGVEFVQDSHSGHWQWKSMDDCVKYIRSH